MEIQFNGVQKALENLARHFGSKLFEILPDLWLEVSSVFKQLEAFPESTGVASTAVQYTPTHTHPHPPTPTHTHPHPPHPPTPTPAPNTPAPSMPACTFAQEKMEGRGKYQHTSLACAASDLLCFTLFLLASPDSFPGSLQASVQHCLSRLQVLRALCSCVHPTLGEQVCVPVCGCLDMHMCSAVRMCTRGQCASYEYYGGQHWVAWLWVVPVC